MTLHGLFVIVGFVVIVWKETAFYGHGNGRDVRGSAEMGIVMQVVKYVFQQHGDDRGQLVALEEQKDIPFEIKRVYYMYDTGEKVRRGYHAHKSLQQILVCIHGSCKILMDDGSEKKVVSLEKPYEGLYISNNIWREMFDFSSDAVLMVLASDYYKEEDYIRDYDDFLKFIRKE